MTENQSPPGSRRAGRRCRRHLKGARHRSVPAPDNLEHPCHEVNVGQAIRTLREERSLSIRALAEASGLAANTLSLIEHGKTSPSVSTLQQLAGALGVPITAFFDVGTSQHNVVHTRAGHGPCASFGSGRLVDLGAGMADDIIEPFLVMLEPDASSGPHPVVHTGQEFVYCLEGRIAYTVEEQVYLLEAGDSLLFEAYLPHRWHNVGHGPARAMLVFCPTDSRDQPRDLHFLLGNYVPVQPVQPVQDDEPA